MDALSLLLDETLPYGEALRRLAREGWPAGGAGASAEQVERARDAPVALRDWWLAPVSRTVWLAMDSGMPRIVSPEDWCTSFPVDRVFALPDHAIGYWSLDPDERVRWIPAPETLPVAAMPLRSWLAAFWVMEAIHGSTAHECTVLDDDALQRALAPLAPLPLSPWPWPAAPTHFHGAGDRLAIISAAPEGGWELRTGTRGEDA